ncbi:hypothetical protein SPSIL_013720 [Sporomusa silvacetica DSM 10669]|uniref:Uncharacterized protein n=1 Tax=Sporomusa silvacetica DSM 10669 TaxID=1123289 RepID=A0ABZ3IIS0_9FIRM|nr:hypothetical protein SPSIL_35910 [Sporomusa silvacetica DSM 10669]
MQFRVRALSPHTTQRAHTLGPKRVCENVDSVGLNQKGRMINESDGALIFLQRGLKIERGIIF